MREHLLLVGLRGSHRDHPNFRVTPGWRDTVPAAIWNHCLQFGGGGRGGGLEGKGLGGLG